MSITSRIMARIYKLPPAETYDIAVERSLEAPMPDGAVLRADRYYPHNKQDLPTVLVRTPYGRHGYGSFGRLFAERGFQSVIQSCRGTDDKSMNVCDGIQRVVVAGPASDPETIHKVSISLWPTAHRFRKGHRIRVQVSSGAFPRFARNLGTGEPLATGTTMRVAEQQIYHDSAHPSAVILPVQKAKRKQL